MDAHPPLPTRASPRAVAGPELARWSLAALVGLALAVAALVAWRRLSGALAQPPGLGALLLVALAASAAARAGRWVEYYRFRAEGGPPTGAAALAVAAAMTVLAAAMTIPGASVPGLAALWGLVAWEAYRTLSWAARSRRAAARAQEDDETSARLRVYAPDRASPPEAVDADAAPVTLPAATSAASSTAARQPGAAMPPLDAAPGDEVLQQIVRSQTPDGGEELSGWFRMPLVPGQRSGSLHVAFCPPLPRAPQVSCQQVSGPEARIKTAQVMPYGARLDVKLSAAAESAGSVVVRLTARSEGSRGG
jgi:hypothetical protein